MFGISLTIFGWLFNAQTEVLWYGGGVARRFEVGGLGLNDLHNTDIPLTERGPTQVMRLSTLDPLLTGTFADAIDALQNKRAQGVTSPAVPRLVFDQR